MPDMFRMTQNLRMAIVIVLLNNGTKDSSRVMTPLGDDGGFQEMSMKLPSTTKVTDSGGPGTVWGEGILNCEKLGTFFFLQDLYTLGNLSTN